MADPAGRLANVTARGLSTLVRRLLAVALVASGCAGVSEGPARTALQPEPQAGHGFERGMLWLGVMVGVNGPAGEAEDAALAGVEAYWDAVNARGGVGGRYQVVLASVVDSDNPEVAATGLAELRDGIAGLPRGVAALAYVSNIVDLPELADVPMPMVRATTTLGDERQPGVLAFATPIELTAVALLEWYRAAGPGATWCVIVDRSRLGDRVGEAARAWSGGRAGGGPGLDQTTHITGLNTELNTDFNTTLDLNIDEIEVVDLDASVVDVADAVADRRCRHVLVEVSERRIADVLEQLPPNLTVARRAELGSDVVLLDDVELLIDPGPPWSVGRSGVMDVFIADWSPTEAPVAPDTRARLGWMSQLRLHALLEAAVADGDLSRRHLMELSATIEPVNFDANTRPGVQRVGMDIGEPVGGGPLRTLRVYGRSDIGADERGLRQVLAQDISPLARTLQVRLESLRPEALREQEQ